MTTSITLELEALLVVNTEATITGHTCNSTTNQ